MSVFEGTEFLLVCVLAMLRDVMTTGRSIEEAQLECVDTGSKTSVECALIDDWCCYCCMCRLGNSKPQSPLFVVQLATLDAVSCLTDVCTLKYVHSYKAEPCIKI